VSTEPLIACRKLTKQFRSVLAVDGIDLAIPAGSCFGLLGPNGAGKTTTVEMLEGIVDPTRGEIRYKGAARDRRFRDESGIMFQATALPEHITALETLKLFAALYPHSVSLESVVENCSLESFIDRDNHRLSGGQRQRLLLAIALVNDPVLLFLDEPTTGLDPQARRNFWDLVERLKDAGKTIVLTTHYMEEAYVLCDEIAIMDRGRIVAQGTPETLLAQHFNDVVLQLPLDDVPTGLHAQGFEIVFRKDAVEILSKDVNETIRHLLDQGIPLGNLQIRRRSLEDLFLEVTGRELRV
jgi:ABC-2 type transport system ATP-binding protein